MSRFRQLRVYLPLLAACVLTPTAAHAQTPMPNETVEPETTRVCVETLCVQFAPFAVNAGDAPRTVKQVSLTESDRRVQITGVYGVDGSITIKSAPADNEACERGVAEWENDARFVAHLPVNDSGDDVDECRKITVQFNATLRSAEQALRNAEVGIDLMGEWVPEPGNNGMAAPIYMTFTMAQLLQPQEPR